MPISLPTKSPTGEQYEDFVAASLKALGYFTESRLTFREGTQEVLELDVLATPVGLGGKARLLFEAKKGSPNFSDVFKLFGQRTYLGIEKAFLVGLKAAEKQHLPVYETKGTELGISICNYTLQSEPENLAPPANAMDPARRKQVLLAAWYQQIASRLCEDALLRECKLRHTSSECQAARTYLFNTRTSFFQQSPLARAESLYSAYFSSPKLSGELVKIVSTEKSLTEQEVWNKINDDDDWPWIQGLIQIETAARLAIIKNALDDVVERGTLPPPLTTLKIGSLSLEIPLHALPSSFHKGLEVIRSHKHSARIPYLFQAFVELLGGFLSFNDPDELMLLESLTGIPASEVVECVELLDQFFPQPGKSFLYKQKNELLCMKMVPGIIRGGGAFLRQKVFGLKEYHEKYPQLGWLVSRWHNALYHFLEPALKVNPP